MLFRSVKHHSIFERYAVLRNPKRVASRDRWDGLREAECWDVKLETSGSGEAALGTVGGILEGWWPGGWELGLDADGSLVRVPVLT